MYRRASASATSRNCLAPVGLGPEAAAGDLVMRPRGHLIDPVPLAEDIDNQGGFHAPAPGQAAA